MEFSFRAIVRHAPEVVYRAYRDELTAVARHVENLAFIEQVSRSDGIAGAEVKNVWHGRGLIPAVARELISPDMLVMDSWTVWHDHRLCSDWLVAPRHFREAFKCDGELVFCPGRDDCTQIIMRGTLRIDLRAVPMVPRLLRSWVEGQVERFLIGMGAPNHRGVADLFAAHLAGATTRRPPGGSSTTPRQTRRCNPKPPVH